MIISDIPLIWVFAWAIFATGFYLIRYRKYETMRNPWIIAAIFAINFFLFAFGILFFIGSEYIRSKRKN